MKEERKKQIDDLAKSLEVKGYDGYVRIRGISAAFLPAREALKKYFELQDRLGHIGPAPPFQLFMTFQATDPSKPSSHLRIHVEDFPNKALHAVSYDAFRIACHEGETLKELSREIDGFKELPTLKELKGLLSDSEEKKDLSKGKKIR